jgi:predicted nucleotidyltransferase component of viral defense system
MSLFDQLVNEALNNRPELAPLRIVVEKEMLHHDILHAFSQAGFLNQLVFMGGTCLRACYGSQRLSEDLDFTGGADFSTQSLTNLSQLLIDSLQTKYGLPVEVKTPTREAGNVDTWKLRVRTRPTRKDQPAQHINIDVCAIPSYQPRPMMLLNPYGVEMGTSGLILQAESREEILADKLVAFALRPNRIKNRDLWDIVWLHQQNIQLPVDLIPLKLQDHHCDPKHFLSLLDARRTLLKTDPNVASEFRKEMRRFLTSDSILKTADQTAFWDFLTNLIHDLCDKIKHEI